MRSQQLQILTENNMRNIRRNFMRASDNRISVCIYIVMVKRIGGRDPRPEHPLFPFHYHEVMYAFVSPGVELPCPFTSSS